MCTAGFREDGSWIRIYPVPHRLLFQYDKPKYGKWQWIEADLEKNPRDARPESFHIKILSRLKYLIKLMVEHLIGILGIIGLKRIK